MGDGSAARRTVSIPQHELRCGEVGVDESRQTRRHGLSLCETRGVLTDAPLQPEQGNDHHSTVYTGAEAAHCMSALAPVGVIWLRATTLARARVQRGLRLQPRRRRPLRHRSASRHRLIGGYEKRSGGQVGALDGDSGGESTVRAWIHGASRVRGRWWWAAVAGWAQRCREGSTRQAST